MKLAMFLGDVEAMELTATTSGNLVENVAIDLDWQAQQD